MENPKPARVNKISRLKFSELTKDQKIILANKVWELDGKVSVDEIAKSFGLTYSQVEKLITFKAKQRQKAKRNRNIDDKREREAEALDRMIIAYFDDAIGNKEEDRIPDKESAYLVLKIMEQKAKLGGLNAPQKIETEANQTIKISYVNDWRPKIKELESDQKAFDAEYKLKELKPHEEE